MRMLAIVAFLVGLLGVAQAADKNDPTGTWKWKTKFGEKEFEQSLKLELKDGKLTGTLIGGKGETNIADGKFKDGDLSFTVTRERGDNKIVSKYMGKVNEDSLKGSITTDFNGKEFKQEWDAKRSKDDKKND